MNRILTWNIGCIYPLIYLKYFGIKYKGQNINHQLFQPILNGGFVSKGISEINPDIIFLQEIWNPEDLNFIEILKSYQYQHLIDGWYREKSMLIASKNEFTILEQEGFKIIYCNGVNYVPVHLNSFSAIKRLQDAEFLVKSLANIDNVVILGDTNIWSRGKTFLFRNDRLAYKKITDSFVDFSKKLLSTTIVGFGLDKVFGSKNLNIQKINLLKIRGDFMDHYPIFFDIL